MHCGVFEKVPAGDDAHSGSDSDSSDNAKPLLLPSNQTVAVTRAKAAGRMLVAEVGKEVSSEPTEREGGSDDALASRNTVLLGRGSTRARLAISDPSG